MGEHAGQAPGHLDRQPRLANAARPCQCHQPDRSARQEIDQASAFGLAPKKAGQHGRQGSVGRMHLDWREGADLVGQGHGFNRRRQAQLRRQ